jgi:hypothetical protein
MAVRMVTRLTLRTMEIFYRIRSKTTGMYISGTPAYGRWTHTGRKFTSLGRIRAYITMSLKPGSDWYGKTQMSDWIIEESQLVKIGDKEISDIITPKKLLELLSK